MTELSLRGWQTRFLRKLSHHTKDDFLLVACPASGKTIGAAVAAAQAMRDRNADQIVVTAPTVVVRDQWVRVLEALGFRMGVMEQDGWPEHVHGVVGTYAQVTRRASVYARQVAARRTVAVFDEVHHAASEREWGESLQQGFGGAVLRLHLSGTPFRSDARTIPFLRYDAAGRSIPDFAYTYEQAVRDGVCRAMRFHAHDGVITWREEDAERTASFSERVNGQDRARRLRAALDPGKQYLRSLLYAANHDLSRLRRTVPSAAGLVVADSQAHALEIDTVLTEIAGEPPVLAMSDIPRSHEAIEAFASASDRWLLSVRMVSEGVDIPRLGVIVWATAATTEMMVRQVSGRALRGRAEYARLPAMVHMPADPELVRYAERIEVLGGVSSARADRHDGAPSQAGKDKRWKGGMKNDSIDPTPFVEWFDHMAGDTAKGGTQGLGTREMCRRCGWKYEPGMRRLYRWRHHEGAATVLAVFDACHMAGVDFFTLFADEQYADARAWLEDPSLRPAGCGVDFGTVEAQPIDAEPVVIEPRVDVPAAALHSEELVKVSTPPLPPSPQMLKQAKQAKQARRAELLRLMNAYTALQRLVDPTFQGAQVYMELARDLGRIGPETPDETVDEAVAWIGEKLRFVARAHPAQFKELAALHRRQELAGGAGPTLSAERGRLVADGSQVA